KAVSKFFIFNLLEFKLSGLVIRSQPLLAGNLFEADHKPSRKFKKLMKSPQDFAGIAEFRFHDTRHPFASWYMMNGGDLTRSDELSRPAASGKEKSVFTSILKTTSRCASGSGRHRQPESVRFREQRHTLPEACFHKSVPADFQPEKD